MNAMLSTIGGCAMLEARIIKTGRGPEIAGTRITVYDVIDYHNAGWHRDMIADTLERRVPSSPRRRTMHRCQRIRQGNPPELQAKLDAAHERLLATVNGRRTASTQ